MYMYLLLYRFPMLMLRVFAGLAVDWVAKNLYWTSDILRGIYVSKTDGRYPSFLLYQVANNPRGITLDPRVGKLFYTDWSVHPFIGRAGMDGSHHTKIIETDLFWPNGITIDYETRRIFWTDAYINRVESADYNGNARYVVSSHAYHAFSLAVFEDTVYWSEWNLRRIERANKRTGLEQRILANLSHNPFDLHVVHPLLKPEHNNPCAENNGGCQQLCLIADGGQSHTCACTRYFILNDDQICRYLQLGCEVKGMGRGHIRRLKENLQND